MAPRLKRWVFLALLASVAIIGMLSSTSGPPMVNLIGIGDYDPYYGPTPEARQIGRLKALLDQTEFRLGELDEHAALSRILARNDADPLVVRRSGGRLEVDPQMTAAAASLWDRLPTRRPELRTVVVQGSVAGWTSERRTLGSAELCDIKTDTTRVATELIGSLRAEGGNCLFAEQFGVAGKGIRDWRKGTWGDISWDRDPRYRRWYRIYAEDLEDSIPVWFRKNSYGDRFGGSYAWRADTRLQMACILGRVETCESAMGVGPEGWPLEVIQRYGYSSMRLPRGQMPQDLLREVGPEKFAAIWTSDDPIAVSYARVTGKPMGEWLMGWVRGRVGALQRDNGLSLSGWLGAVIWIGLFALLVAERLKQRSAT